MDINKEQILASLLAVTFIICYPFILLWCIDTLLNIGIDYGFQEWLAMQGLAVLILIFKGGKGTNE